MKRICFLVNALAEVDFLPLLGQYLPGCLWAFAETLPEDWEHFDLVVPWNYRRRISLPGENRNVVVFHASDLPEGRGWAPLYHTFAERLEQYTLTAILIDEGIDTGDIVAKARFKIQGNHTATFVREWDTHITLRLIAELLGRFDGRRLRGIRQPAEGCYRPRRHPEDSRVDLSKPLAELIPHLRGVEDRHPAFFDYEGHRYRLKLQPEVEPAFPTDLQFEFFVDVEVGEAPGP